MKHPLTVQRDDLLLELKIWFFAWLTTAIALFAGAIYYLYPTQNGWAWRSYLLSKILDFVGLGSYPVLPPDWQRGGVFLDYISEKLPAETLSRWDSDLLILLQTPLLAGAIVIAAYLFFFSNKERIEK